MCCGNRHPQIVKYSFSAFNAQHHIVIIINMQCVLRWLADSWLPTANHMQAFELMLNCNWWTSEYLLFILNNIKTLSISTGLNRKTEQQVCKRCQKDNCHLSFHLNIRHRQFIEFSIFRRRHRRFYFSFNQNQPFRGFFVGKWHTPEIGRFLHQNKQICATFQMHTDISAHIIQ